MSELNMDIDAILDGTLDDLADLPEFKPFPVGTHRCKVELSLKDIDEKNGKKAKAVEVKLTGIETVELPAGSTDAPINAGDSCNVLYFLTHSNPKTAEFGQGGFKNLMKCFAEHFGVKKNSELMAEANGSECLVVTKQRINNDTKAVYVTIDNLVVA